MTTNCWLSQVCVPTCTLVSPFCVCLCPSVKKSVVLPNRGSLNKCVNVSVYPTQLVCLWAAAAQSVSTGLVPNIKCVEFSKMNTSILLSVLVCALSGME